MPVISGPLITSSGGAPSAQFEIQVGDQAVFRAFENVVGEALIERKVGGAFFFRRAGAARSVR